MSTPLLGLALPPDGTTNWGTLVNTSITALLDSAVAGTTTLSADSDVTLTNTVEVSNQARQAILLCSGARTALRTITAPAQSKTYIVINNTSGGYGVKLVGVGPTPGVTIPAGKVYMLAWNGSDFVTIGVTTVNLATDVTGVLPTANGGTGLGGATPFTANRVFYASSASAVAQSANFTFNGTTVAIANDASISGLTVGRGAGAEASNTAVGVSALQANTTGTFNVAIGASSLTNNSSGAANTIVGYAAGLSITTANYNTAIGQQSLVTNQTGGVNTAIGWGSLYTTTGSFNTAVGANSGLYITTGSKNTIIGGYTGNQGGLDIRTASNYVVLSDGDGNPRAYWNGNSGTMNGPLTVVSTLRTAVQSVTSGSTITPAGDAGNQFDITALAVPATIAAPSGTPVNGQKLLIRLKDNGTARALTWNAAYRVIGVTLPTTTVATKTTYVGCVYNSADAVWDVVAVTTQA